VGFNIAYLISSLATILMISVFAGALFREKKTALIIFSMLVIVYSFIFVLLTLNDYAYLAGNIGLFLLLAVIMRFASNLELFRKARVFETGE
jgi:inner membrane protein